MSLLALAGLLLFAGAASAQEGEHGIGGSKGCEAFTQVFDPVFCTYTIRNNSDDFGDTMQAHSVVDTMQTAGGAVNSGEIFDDLHWVFNPTPGSPGAPTCTGGSGLGTDASPYVGAMSCDLPDGSSIGSQPFSFYTAQPADFALQDHRLTDHATYTVEDLCDGDGSENCPPFDLTNSPNSQTTVVRLASSTTTDIHDATHSIVTSVQTGTTVHDLVTVTGEQGKPVPDGNVNVDWFTNNTCTGAPASNSGSVGPLDAAGKFDATGFSQTPGAGSFAFRGHYEGSNTYEASDGPCEPLTVNPPPPPPPPPPPVPDARISITPATATNPVNTNHVLTAHVDVQTNTGQPFTNAPDGTQITLSIASGPGSFTTTNPCVTSGGTGSCTVTLTSAEPGTTVVNATTTVTVSGQALTRTTNGQAGNSGPAQKTWIALLLPACDTLSARPRQLQVGKTALVVARAVLDNGRPMRNARVLLTAPGGIAMAKRTNAQGVVTFRVKPTKTGILRLRVATAPQCAVTRGIAPPDLTG